MLLNSIPGKKANVLLGGRRLTQTQGAFICLSSVDLKAAKISFQKHLLISGLRAKMKGLWEHKLAVPQTIRKTVDCHGV